MPSLLAISFDNKLAIVYTRIVSSSRQISIPDGATAQVDRIGIAASSLCVIHCILTPIVLSFTSVAAHFLPSEEKTHRTLAIFIAAIGLMALVRGYSRHKRHQVVALMIVGLALIVLAALWGDRLPSHWCEVGITFLGSACMISSHLLNRTFSRQCDCCSEPAQPA